MYYHKIHHPNNFVFAKTYKPSGGLRIGKNKKQPLDIEPHGTGLIRCELRGVGPDYSAAGLKAKKGNSGSFSVTPTARGGLRIRGQMPGDLLKGPDAGWFGRCGDAWIMRFDLTDDMRFYGLGEKNISFEHRGKRTLMWNTDACGDFTSHQIQHGSYDPMYASIPYLIIKRGSEYLGILVENPGAVFFDLGSNYIWNGTPDASSRPSIFFGAPAGAAIIWFLHGPSLPELTRRLQKLCGTTPLPPLWALGHQQCRWGYKGPSDLKTIADGFTRHGIPNSGLWLDIDYMDKFRVFTLNPETFKNPRKELAELSRSGQRVVAILDPGVKAEKGYRVCDDGLRQGVFCLAPEKIPFSGYVWPGRTYFPDYSLPKTRTWWASYVKEFGETGFAGAWIDMNDPSIGPLETDAMLFHKGLWPHWSWHNQYALGMAQATREGFQMARPKERPFVVSRSASTGSSRYTAVWTGDNVSNWHNLRLSIPLSLNLALSGIPFNGPDVCGFGENTHPELASAWYQAGFLFPFFRNHSSIHTRQQEPWNLGAKALRIIRRYIRLRYRLLPYIYQLFVNQEITGEAILRPLFYEFSAQDKDGLDKIHDQFMVGPSIMQAPLLHEGKKEREVLLPGENHWLCARSGLWFRGGQKIQVTPLPGQTPLYFAENSLIPSRLDPPASPTTNLQHIQIHLFFKGKGRGRLRYHYDDGLTHDYQQGKRSTIELEASSDSQGKITIHATQITKGFGACRIQFVTYSKSPSLTLHYQGKVQHLPLRNSQDTWTGNKFAVYRSSEFSFC